MKAAIALVVLLVACKGKKPDAQPTPPPTPGSASAVATVEPDAATPAPAKAVVIPPGVANFGCLGWSKSAKAAACITGESALGEPAKFALTYLGGTESPTPITVKQGGGEDMFDDVTAANASLAKLGVEPFAGDAKDIEPGKTTDLGGGAALDWKTKETKKGGDNTAPTIRHEVVVTCANKATAEVLKVEEEGNNPEMRAWSAPEHVILDFETNIGREGESRRISTPMLLELATCKLTKTK
jgi:hypothetical protein